MRMTGARYRSVIDSQKTLHTSPSRVSNGVSFVNISGEIWCVIKRIDCIFLFSRKVAVCSPVALTRPWPSLNTQRPSQAVTGRCGCAPVWGHSTHTMYEPLLSLGTRWSREVGRQAVWESFHSCLHILCWMWFRKHMYLHFPSFLSTEMAHVLQILLHGRLGSFYPAHSIPWTQMALSRYLLSNSAAFMIIWNWSWLNFFVYSCKTFVMIQ